MGVLENFAQFSFKVWNSFIHSFFHLSSALLTLSLVALSLSLGVHLFKAVTVFHAGSLSLSPVFPWTSAMSEKTFENVPVSVFHIVLSLILQAHCQRRLCTHPWGDGSAEGPGCCQPVTVRRQLPERRQPDPQSARQNQVRGRGEEAAEGDFEFR